ncbi:hypothetical protein [Mucilaginibacter sp. AK015]|uniref:hypothetical protein n=1 Tax=Mucilaginibacter sp. AK015 TaxID=2723072 RepID=UPI00160D8DF7|nr:hypothetical protein [Mucilaginibacter sp. AK015]MBB5396441.1 hypothetical protein [Mucilaginibacter sp. AK015]
MKIINTDTPINASDYADFLRQKLLPLFKERRQVELTFNIVNTDDSIEIQNTDIYDGFLFRFEFKGNEVDVIKSEHYTDDVNVLTLEDILNNLYMEFPGRDNISLIEEGS